jgi:hypothetical protein
MFRGECSASAGVHNTHSRVQGQLLEGDRLSLFNNTLPVTVGYLKAFTVILYTYMDEQSRVRLLNYKDGHEVNEVLRRISERMS